MLKKLSAAIAVMALLCSVTAGSVFASRASVRVQKNGDMGLLRMDSYGGLYQFRLLLPGTTPTEPDTSKISDPLLPLQSAKDTVGFSLAAKVVTVPSKFNDSLQVGGLPRTLNFLIANGATAIDAGSVIITGTDITGAALLDTLTVLNDTKSQHYLGAKAFWTVTTIKLPAFTKTNPTLWCARGSGFGLIATGAFVDRYCLNGLPQVPASTDTSQVHATQISKDWWRNKLQTMSKKTLDLYSWVPKYQGITARTAW